MAITFVDGRLFKKPPILVTSMVDALIKLTSLKLAVDITRPHLSPMKELIFAVPLFRDWILFAILTALGLFVHALQAFCL